MLKLKSRNDINVYLSVTPAASSSKNRNEVEVSYILFENVNLLPLSLNKVDISEANLMRILIREEYPVMIKSVVNPAFIKSNTLKFDLGLNLNYPEIQGTLKTSFRMVYKHSRLVLNDKSINDICASFENLGKDLVKILSSKHPIVKT